METTIGMIGLGHMGRAILERVLRQALVPSSQVYLSDLDLAKTKPLQDTYGCLVASNQEVAQAADVLILAIKPQQYEEVIDEIKDVVKPEVIIIDIAASVSLQDVHDYFGRDIKTARVMPNTPALIGEGMSGIAFDEFMEEADRQKVIRIFASVGQVGVVKESQIDAVASVSGASPAYVYLFIEALADGDVMLGLSREEAYRFASQAVVGAAKMVQQTGEHPAKLKDAVCSPGGTTIEAIAKLEEKGFRSAIIEAMRANDQKAKKMKQ